MNSILRFLRSLKLSLSLLIILIPIIAAGNLVPQQGRVPPWEIQAWQKDHPVLSVLTDWSGFHHVYTSWWLLFIFTLLCLNMAIATWELIGRTATKAKGLHRFKRPVSAFQSFYVLTELALPEQSALALERELSARGYRLVTGDGEIYARKGWLGIWGGTLMHVGLVVILAGAVVSGLTRFTGYTEMGAGQLYPESAATYVQSSSGPLFDGHQPNVEISVDAISEKDEGFMTVVVSEVTITDRGRVVAKKSLRMNEPLAYAGMTVYQARYDGPALLFEVKGAGIDQPILGYVNLKSGSAQSSLFTLEPTPFQASVVYSEGNQHADLEIRKDKTLVYQGRIVPGQAVEAQGQSVTLVAIKRWSGIIVVYDRGAMIVFLGFFLAVLGIAIMGFFDPREIWLKKTGVILGWGRWRNLFLEEFESIMKGKEKWQT